ncbi:ATP-dependent acyl-CoA ligase [Exilibacterium tricleocarpae]|uniref:ATP-dependent acyl-CoA ligase n=1 Tax=Exilibacterium tricleocarpae TaxID=2591008 RepID=A0A545TNQ1_9GAMM|nr:AMP-binding protein [Exilibacterium tricleocarpae]TQV78845.1 ATP-dependent acyl-CoA ligase [Exilibacterium tricleocarpae]
MSSVYQAFRDSVEAYAQQPFLCIPAAATRGYSDSAVELSYGATGAAVERLRRLYCAAGYGCGHRVALLLENRAAFFLHWLALNALGVSAVPVNGDMTDAETAYLLSHSEVCLAVCIPERQAALQCAARQAGIELPVIHPDEKAIPAARSAPLARPVDHRTECALLYTSGSTGRPKGCVLSNDYFLSNGRWYNSIGDLCALENGKERLLTPLPLVHMNAMACSAMAMIMSGGCLVQLDRFHPHSWWETAAQSRATIVHYLGVMPAILLNMPPAAAETRHRLRFGFGAGVNPAHHRAFEQRFGFPLIEAWAMTESGCAGAIIASREPRHIGSACIGKPGPAIEVKLVDEQGREVASGKAGELLVRAAGDNPRKGFFTEYLKDAAATAAIWADNWLHTGDVVRFGSDGQLHFVDRRKNVIRRSGENISALEVEAALALHPTVDQVAVAPVPDELRGDEVMACIVLKPETAANNNSAQALFEHCRAALVYYKAPGYIAFVDQLPLTASQKPQRAELKTLCRELLAAADCFDLREQKKRGRISA